MPPGPAPTLESLVASARAGDERARALLLSRLEPVVRSFFIQRIGLKPEVDDLAQNTLLRIHHSLPDLKQPDRLKGFALKAALFELQDLYRGRYSARERLYDPENPPPYVQADASVGLKVDVERALATLTPRARRIVELKEYGYRYEEIAEMLGTTEAAVKMQVKRAFEKLRDLLAAGAGLLWLLAR